MNCAVCESDLIISRNKWTKNGNEEGMKSPTCNGGTVLGVEIGVNLLVRSRMPECLLVWEHAYLVKQVERRRITLLYRKHCKRDV